MYVGTSDTGLLLALDKATGAERWRFDTGVWTFESPLRVGDAVVAAAMTGEAYVLDAATGMVRCQYRTDEARREAMRIIDAKTGKFDNARLFGNGLHGLYAAMEHVKRLGAFSASPLWADGKLVLATATGEVLFFE